MVSQASGEKGLWAVQVNLDTARIPGPTPTSCSLSESCNIVSVKFDISRCLVGRENPLQSVKTRKSLLQDKYF